MQTFLPLPDLRESLLVLDKRRLGKQRVETSQILATLSGSSKGWVNHPAVRMWRGYEEVLKYYFNLSLEVFALRGGNNIKLQPVDVNPAYLVYPPWFGNPDFHAGHRSNLLRKDPVFYGRYGWTEPSNLPYIWPVE